MKNVQLLTLIGFLIAPIAAYAETSAELSGEGAMTIAFEHRGEWLWNSRFDYAYAVTLSADGNKIEVRMTESWFSGMNETEPLVSVVVWNLDLKEKKVQYKLFDDFFGDKKKYKPGRQPGAYIEVAQQVIRDLQNIQSIAPTDTQKKKIQNVIAAVQKLLNNQFSVSTLTNDGNVTVQQYGKNIIRILDGKDIYTFNAKTKALTYSDAVTDNGLDASFYWDWKGDYLFANYPHRNAARPNVWYKSDKADAIFLLEVALASQTDLSSRGKIQSAVDALTKPAKR